jgi:hypothetical protein
MRLILTAWCALVMALAEPGAAGEGAAGVAVRPDTFAVRIGNRMYPEWKEDVRVALNEAFYLGDTDLVARAVEYLPDFRIGDEGPFSASAEPANPALHVKVFRDTTAVDSSWAFLNFPPHFSPTSFFTFQLIGLNSSEGERKPTPAAEPTED